MTMNMNPPNKRLHVRTVLWRRLFHIYLNAIKFFLVKVYFHHWLPVCWEIILMAFLPILGLEISFFLDSILSRFPGTGLVNGCTIHGCWKRCVSASISRELWSYLHCSWLRLSSSRSSSYWWYRLESSKLLSSPSINGKICPISERLDRRLNKITSAVMLWVLQMQCLLLLQREGRFQMSPGIVSLLSTPTCVSKSWTPPTPNLTPCGHPLA